MIRFASQAGRCLQGVLEEAGRGVLEKYDEAEAEAEAEEDIEAAALPLCLPPTHDSAVLRMQLSLLKDPPTTAPLSSSPCICCLYTGSSSCMHAFTITIIIIITYSNLLSSISSLTYLGNRLFLTAFCPYFRHRYPSSRLSISLLVTNAKRASPFRFSPFFLPLLLPNISHQLFIYHTTKKIKSNHSRLKLMLWIQ